MSVMSAGTSVSRTTKASTRTATANPMPIADTMRSPLKPNEANTKNMIVAAVAMTRPVSLTPTRTAPALSRA